MSREPFIDLSDKDEVMASIGWRDKEIARLQAEVIAFRVLYGEEQTKTKRLQALVDAARPAAQFCLWCCEYFFEGNDICGGDAQDKMVELGLLEQRPTPEDSEWYGECDFLYFPTKAFEALGGES